MRDDIRSGFAIALLGFMLVAACPSAAWQVDVERGSPGIGTSVAVDGQRNVFVGGAKSANFLVAKLEGASGDRIWRTVVRKGVGIVLALAVDPDGDAIAAGQLRAEDSSFAVLKLSSDLGRVLWSFETSGGPGTLSDSANAVVADGAGDVVATGTLIESPLESRLVVVKLAGENGAETWRTTFGNNSGDGYAVVGTAGDVVAAGHIDGDFAVVKLSGTDGGELWTYVSSHEGEIKGEVRALAVDSAGNVIAAGTTTKAGSEPNFVVVKLSGATGLEIWRHEVDGTAGDSRDGAYAVAVDSGDDVVAGGSLENAGQNDDFVVMKLLGAPAGTVGAEIWRTEITGTPPLNSFDIAYSLDLDAAGDVAVAGALDDPVSRSDIAIVKLSGTDGAILWQNETTGRSASFPGSSDQAFAVAFDADGSVIAVGDTDNRPNPTGRDTITAIKLSGVDGVDVLAGHKISLRERNGVVRMRFIASEGVGVDPRDATNPEQGTTIELRNPITGESVQTDVTGDNWKQLGPDDKLRGYRFKGSGPCRRVLIKASKMKLACDFDAADFSLDEPSQGSLAIKVTTGAGPVRREYCAVFDSGISVDGPGRFRARKAPAPAECP